MLIIKSCSLLALIISTVVLQQCGNTQPEYRNVVRLPREQQAEAFRKYPLEQQVDIYMYAMRGVEPPATQFSAFLASNGRKAIPLLLTRLKEAKDDGSKIDLIRVLTDMHTDYCSLKDDREVIATLRAVISEMKDKVYKEWGERELKKLSEQSGKSNSC